ncbi:MAG: siphovirus Gp157 family protein [Candidatus Sericytochromatia bacterium]
MQTKSLFDIQTDYLEIIRDLETTTQSLDEISAEELDALNARLEINQAEFLSKSDAYAAVISEKTNRAGFLRIQAERLREMAEHEEKVAERLRQRIAQAMQQQGLQKAETSHFRFSFRRSEAVELSIPVPQLPEQFVRTKTTYEADKTALKQHLKQGIQIQGVSLAPRKTLQIR